MATTIANINKDGLPDFKTSLSTAEVKIDSAQAFLLWVSSRFDVEATAHALGIPAVRLQVVIDDECWLDRVAPIVAKIKSSKPGDFERACNRSIAFVQGHRFRLVCERVINEMNSWTDAELRANLLPETTSKLGLISSKISTRWLCDFSAALHHCNNLCFAALNDTATERAKKDSSEEVPILDVHAAIAKAMTGVAESKTPRNLLLNSQLEVAESIAAQASFPRKPVPPPDDTFVDESGG